MTEFRLQIFETHWINCSGWLAIQDVFRNTYRLNSLVSACCSPGSHRITAHQKFVEHFLHDRINISGSSRTFLRQEFKIRVAALTQLLYQVVDILLHQIQQPSQLSLVRLDSLDVESLLQYLLADMLRVQIFMHEILFQGLFSKFLIDQSLFVRDYCQQTLDLIEHILRVLLSLAHLGF